MLTVAQLAPLKDKDPYLYETLTKIVSAVNATSQNAAWTRRRPRRRLHRSLRCRCRQQTGGLTCPLQIPRHRGPGSFISRSRM